VSEFIGVDPVVFLGFLLLAGGGDGDFRLLFFLALGCFGGEIDVLPEDDLLFVILRLRDCKNTFNFFYS